MSADPESDQDQFVALQRGDDRALNRLIDRWQKPLFAFAWRYMQNNADARDLVAETFVRLYQQRERLRPDTRVSAWLFTTLTNLCHNQHRWRRRHPAVSFQAPDANGASLNDVLASDSPRPSSPLEHDEALRQLLAAVDRLPHDLKTTVLLHHYEGLSYQEIGDITGCSVRGVETRLYRAKQKLREELSALIREAAKP
ncbi:MAG TPA: sigma-70 family RNA polymerase sigma factor [Opitutaceae bacterium]|nr:sigma-70 family RNA polymerase sigma factor [Opitutaceae bacterium]